MSTRRQASLGRGTRQVHTSIRFKDKAVRTLGAVVSTVSNPRYYSHVDADKQSSAGPVTAGSLYGPSLFIIHSSLQQ